MSGGVAYVLDEKGDFETRLNKEMVELEAITADPGSLTALAKQNGNVAVALTSVMADMRAQDAERLHALIVRHAHYTNSAKAQLILSDWPAWLPKFRKVMPLEFRRALAEIAKAAEGADKLRVQA
jgi:glutamate synthase (NADPH/NADH) large chain